MGTLQKSVFSKVNVVVFIQHENSLSLSEFHHVPISFSWAPFANPSMRVMVSKAHDHPFCVLGLFNVQEVGVELAQMIGSVYYSDKHVTVSGVLNNHKGVSVLIDHYFRGKAGLYSPDSLKSDVALAPDLLQRANIFTFDFPVGNGNIYCTPYGLVRLDRHLDGVKAWVRNRDDSTAQIFGGGSEDQLDPPYIAFACFKLRVSAAQLAGVTVPKPIKVGSAFSSSSFLTSSSSSKMQATMKSTSSNQDITSSK